MAIGIMQVRCKLVDVANIIRAGGKGSADQARKLITEVRELHKSGVPLSDSQVERVDYYATIYGMNVQKAVKHREPHVSSGPDLPMDPS